MSRNRAGFALWTIVGLAAIASVAPGTRLSARQLVDRVAARVNNEIITENEILMAGFSGAESPLGPDLRATLNNLIDERLLAQAAREQIKEIPEERIANTVETEIKARRALFSSEQAFLAALEQRGWDLASYKENLRKQEERRYLVRVAVARRVRITKAQVSAYEEQLKRTGKPLVRYRLQQIFLALPAQPTQTDVTKVEERMLALLEEITRGVAFEELVREHSEDKAARLTGGDLGWMDEKSMQPAILEAVRSLEVGKLSQPVRTAKGLHLFRLAAKRTPREMLFHERVAEVSKEWVAELRRRGRIEILLPQLRK